LKGESSKNFAEFQAPSFEGPANPKSKIQNPKLGDSHRSVSLNVPNQPLVIPYLVIGGAQSQAKIGFLAHRKNTTSKHIGDWIKLTLSFLALR
jgi:hypothetical protein